MSDFGQASTDSSGGARGASWPRGMRAQSLQVAVGFTLAALMGLAACSSGSGDPLDVGNDLPRNGDGSPLPGGGDPNNGGGGSDDPTGGGSGGSATPYEVGEVLAKVELETPQLENFMLRATIPLPPGIFPMAGGLAPFAIRDPSGVETPAQVEVVSWYAASQQGADVVELISKVERPQSFVPGGRIAYEVIWSPHPVGQLNVDPDILALIAAPGSLSVRSHDVFGSAYTADLLGDLRQNTSELRVLRNGEFAHQVRTHETMLATHPVPGPSGTLPHFMGVHSFITLWDDESFFSIDLRVHNGHDGLDTSDPTDDPLGKMYFREFELVVPEGWNVYGAFEDPMFGEPYTVDGHRVWPIVMPMPDGSMHMMPQQAQFHRRLVVAKNGSGSRARMHLREGGLAFCQPGISSEQREYFSWWNPDTARFFPQKERLPELWHLGAENVRTWIYNRFRVYEAALLQGNASPFPVVIGNLGWAHPWGLNIGYAHGGDEIHLFDGVRTAYGASKDGYRLFQVAHRMSTERHPTALYDGDGDAFTMEDWIVEGPTGPYVPVYIWIYPVLFLADPFGFGNSPTHQRDAVSAMGQKPPYEETLLSWELIDRAHLIRYTRSPKALAWLGNDALAKDDLHMQGELARISYTSLPQGPTGQYIYTGLWNDRLDVDANPGNGFAIHRGEGWGADAMVAAYCLGTRAWREKTRSWFYDLLDLLDDGISECTGIIQGDPNLDTFGGEYRSRQSISAAIMQNAFWGVMQSVFGERDRSARDRMASILRRDLYAMISELVWNEEYNAPWFYVAVGPYDLTLPEFCGDYPPDGFLYTDPAQTWCAFAYGYRLTGDPAFLDHAMLMLGQPLNTYSVGQSEFGVLENRTALLALVQELFE